MGSVLLMVSVKTLAFVPLLVVNRPLKKLVPLVKGAHGEAKVD